MNVWEIMTENVDQPSDLHNNSEICRICLITNVKMFSVQKYELYEKYRDVTGIQVSQDDIYPGFLCWECTHQLLSCHRFKTRAILSHCLMTGLLENDKCVTEQNIRKINRHKNGLVSKLKQHRNPPNCFNLEVTEEDSSDLVQNEKQDNNNVAVPVVKNEDEDDDEDDDDFPGEEIKEESIKLVNLNVKEESSDDDRPLTELTEKVVVIIRNNSIPKPKTTKLAESKTKGVKSKTNKTTAKTKQKTTNQKIAKSDDTVEKKTVTKTTILSELDPSDFDVTTLTIEEQMSEIEKRKKTKNYIESNFKCDKCYKGFMDDAAFKFHLILHTKESGEHECEICKLRFRNRRALRRHKICHTQKFVCKHCAYVTTRSRHAKLHADFHKGMTYKCPHCYQVFSKCSTYMTHLRIKHPSDIACELCGYSFVSHRGLYLHKNLMHRFEKHQPEDNVSCEQCGITFLKKEALETHLKVSSKHVTHSEGKLVKERNCREYQGRIKKDQNIENKATEKDDKKREPRRRTPRRTRKPEPIQCELCEAQLNSGIAYYWHFQRAHPGRNRTAYPQPAGRRRDMCDVCGRMFTSLAALEDHKSIHGSDQQFKCPYCEKTFKRKYGVVEHLSRVHRGKKRTYGCSVCGKEFNSSFNMQRHMLIHTGVREFECPMCGKLFKDVVDRKLHITHVHMKVPWPKRNRGSRTKKQEPSLESEASSTNTEQQPLTNTEIW